MPLLLKQELIGHFIVAILMAFASGVAYHYFQYHNVAPVRSNFRVQ